MSTPALPQPWLDPELLEAAESVILDGETLTRLVETSLRQTIQRRRA